MKNKILIILSVFLLAGCIVPNNFPRAKYKVDKIVNAWPEVLQNDTIILTDTVVVPESIIDTITQLQENDTVFIEKERLKIRLIRMPNDTIQITAECKTDTITLIKKVPVYKIDKYNLRGKGGWKWWYWILICAGSLLLIYIILRFWPKKSK